MSAFRGILTGFGMAAIKDKEAKDNAKLDVVRAAGIDYYTNQLPAHKKSEENRAQTYSQLTKILGSEQAADYWDANGFITGDENDLEKIMTILKEKEIKPEAFKNYLPTTNYEDRYKGRQTSFEDRFNIVSKSFNMQGSGLGNSTIKGLLTKPPGSETTTEQITTPAVQAKSIEGTPLMTEAIPETTKGVTTTVRRTTAESPISEFFVPKTISSDLGKENDIANSFSSYRGFGNFMTIDPITKNITIKFLGNKDTEFNAMKQVLNQIGSQYIQDDGKVNLTAATAEAHRILYNQTQGIIKQHIVTGFKETSDKSGIVSYTATGFNKDFNKQFPDIKSKQKELFKHMQLLGTKPEQLYFAISFPSNLIFDDGTSVGESNNGILTWKDVLIEGVQ